MKRIYLVSYLLVAVFTLSCKAVDYSETPPAPDSQFVTADDQLLIDRGLKVLQLSDAERVAQRFMLKGTKKMFSVSAATRADHLTAVRDSAGNPVMYVVNFEQGGFCIVSATKKAYPILAHSDEGFFDLEKVGQSGVCIWLDEMVYGITHRDTLSEEERIFVNSAWAEYEKGFDLTQTRASDAQNAQRAEAFNNRMSYHMGQGHDPIPLNGAIYSGSIPDYVISGAQYAARNAGCPEEYIIIVRIDATETKSVGPLLKTEWHQWSPFNNSCPKINGQAPPAGCVAIAMAQIMNYHKWPSRFNWANMVGNYVDIKADAANFIYQIGVTVNMKYGLGGSYAYSTDACSAFNQKFGYSAAVVNDAPESELWDNRPYYSSGQDAIEGGHAWVVDGARKMTQNKVYGIESPSYSGGQYTYQVVNTYNYNPNYFIYSNHINWGWGLGSPNGWYTLNVSKPYNTSYDFSGYRRYITIKPNKTIIRPPGGGIIIEPPFNWGGGTIIPIRPIN